MRKKEKKKRKKKGKIQIKILPPTIKLAEWFFKY